MPAAACRLALAQPGGHLSCLTMQLCPVQSGQSTEPSTHFSIRGVTTFEETGPAEAIGLFGYAYSIDGEGTRRKRGPHLPSPPAPRMWACSSAPWSPPLMDLWRWPWLPMGAGVGFC